MSAAPKDPPAFQLGEARIEDILAALEAGWLTAVELTVLYLNRIFAYDRSGPRLNSIPVLNPAVLTEAAASDARRASGAPPRPLEGVPFTVKDSYKVKGLTVAAGSPAFAGLLADEDAFTVARIREAGGVLIGKTNMPPLADGGLHRGVYGRAESPYNGDYLTAAWNSGSSNGSGTSTAASFAAFSMGEETVSSGRSPASNNGLVAYTPSRGLISVRGNWPLRPLRDVVVPMTRSVDDLLRVLDVVVAADPESRGDLWRSQSIVDLPSPSDIRPASYPSLADAGALRGKRIGVPTIYLGKDDTGHRFHIRPSILELWARAAADLEALGASIVEVGMPLYHDYEQDRPDARSPVARGLIPEAWWHVFNTGVMSSSRLEKVLLSACAWQDFLASCNDPGIASWTDVATASVFPYPPASVDFQRKGPFDPMWHEVRAAIADGLPAIEQLPGIADAIRGLETIRKVDFEDWLCEQGLDGIVFPANGDVGRASSDTVEADHAFATSRGVAVSNGGGMIRHLGIPTVSVPMGMADDLQMPVNLTFAGPAYGDNALLAWAWAYERVTQRRRAPSRTPPLAGEIIPHGARAPVRSSDRAGSPPHVALDAKARLVPGSEGRFVEVAGTASGDAGLASVELYVNGQLVGGPPERRWARSVPLDAWRDATGALGEVVHVVVLVKDHLGAAAADTRPVARPRF